MNIMKKIGMIIFLFIFTLSYAQESVVLRYNYKKGDRYELKMTMNQKMGPIGGLDMEMTSEMNVLKASNNGFEISNRAKRVQVNMLQGDKEVKYDSDAKIENLSAEAKQLAPQFGAMMKATAYQTFSNQGKLINMRVEPSIPNNLANNKDIIGYTIFPKEAVKVGSTWSQDLNVEGMILNMTYTVKSITSKNVNADIKGKLTVMGIKTDLSGMVSFDRKTGNTDQMSVNASIDMQGVRMSMNAAVSVSKK